jgi:hypothetical protein
MKILPLTLALLLCADAALAQACNPAITSACLIEPTAAQGEDVAPYCFLPTLSRGQYETLYALTANDDEGVCHNFETYLRFDLPANLLDPGETVTNAILLVPYLFSFAFGGTPTPPPHPPVALRVYRVESFWSDEDSITWGNRPGYAAAPVAEHTGITNYGLREFDVTSLVREWAHGTRPNYGFALTSPNDRALGFYSWEAEVPTSQKVRLLIQTGPGAAPPQVPVFPY